jgi:hypothetical protein
VDQSVPLFNADLAEFRFLQFCTRNLSADRQEESSIESQSSSTKNSAGSLMPPLHQNPSHRLKIAILNENASYLCQNVPRKTYFVKPSEWKTFAIFLQLFGILLIVDVDVDTVVPPVPVPVPYLVPTYPLVPVLVPVGRQCSFCYGTE